MTHRLILVTAVALTLALPSDAAEVRVRQMHVTPLAVPGQEHAPDVPIPAAVPIAGPRQRDVETTVVNPNLTEGPSTLLV